MWTMVSPNDRKLKEDLSHERKDRVIEMGELKQRREQAKKWTIRIEFAKGIVFCVFYLWHNRPKAK